jgi:hypothetical protein
MPDTRSRGPGREELACLWVQQAARQPTARLENENHLGGRPRRGRGCTVPRLRAAALTLLILAACSGSGHHHAGPINHDPHRLYVEITGEGARRSRLRAGAAAGLARVSFARVVDRGGDVELQVEVSQLDVTGNVTVCKVKILIFRLPSHDLLGIADGGARAAGTGDRAGDDCVEAVSTSLVRGKLRPLLKRRLDAKR